MTINSEPKTTITVKFREYVAQYQDVEESRNSDTKVPLFHPRCRLKILLRLWPDNVVSDHRIAYGFCDTRSFVLS